MRGGGSDGKKNKKRHKKSVSSSSSDSGGGGSSTDSDSDSEDDRKSKKSSARALGKLRTMQEAEELAMREGLYGDAARRAGGLTALMAGGTAEERRLFSMRKSYSDFSSDGDGSTGEEARERTRLARKSLASV
jgi:hypothetical protein